MTAARSRLQRSGPSKLEEWPHVLSASAATDPQHPLAHGLDDDGRVAVALLDGEFVHADHLQPIEIDRAELMLQAGEVQVLDCLPVQSEEAGHVSDRGHATQLRHRFAQAPGEPGIRLQPAQPLQPRPTARAGHAHPRHDQLHPVLEDRQLTNAPLLLIVNRPGRLATVAALA